MPRNKLIFPAQAPIRVSVSQGNFEMPYAIRKIYEAALKHNYILTCEKLDWMHPTGYKIGIYMRHMLNFIDYTNLIEIDSDFNPDEFEIATFVLQARKAPILCPLAKDQTAQQ